MSELFMYGLQKIRGKCKLVYSVFAVAIFMGVFSVSGFATRNISGYEEEKGYNYVYFGGIVNGANYSNPTSSNANATSSYLADTSSGHSYQDGGNTKYALKFRVLDITSNDGETPALFMLTEYAIGERRWDTGSSGTQVWGTSEIRRWLNGYKANNEKPSEGEKAAYDNSVLPTCFSEEEQAAIMETTTHEAGEALYWYKNSNGSRWAGRYEDSKVDGIANQQVPLKSNQLEGDKIFLLSAEEVTNPEYGFVNNKNESVSSGSVYAEHASRVCAQANVTGGSVWWWLRSAYSHYDFGVDDVYRTGASTHASSYDTNGAVRFGLNVHLSSVIYASKAGINLASVASPSTFKPMDRIAPSGDNPEYKLTILDKITPEKQSFTTDKNSIIAGVGNAIKINYSGAVYSTSAHECISAVIRDITSGDILYYAYLKRCTTAQDESGELTIDIPDNLEPGSYKLMVMNERICGEYQTNSASVSDITLNIVENYPLACDIRKPVYSQAGSTYDYVYFGEADSEKVYDNIGATDNQSQYVVEGQSDTVKKAPIKFRVLDTTSNGYDKDDTNKKRVPALFMLTEYAIGQRRWDTGDACTQVWGTSEMRRWLNGYTTNNVEPGVSESAAYNNSVLPTCFKAGEKAVIMQTSTDENGKALLWYENGSTRFWAGTYEGTNETVRGTDTYNIHAPDKSNKLNGEKIFLLSAEEVTNPEYGFSNGKNSGSGLVYNVENVNRKCMKANDIATGCGVWWWLRSAYSYDSHGVAGVGSTGASDAYGSNYQYGVVRFGLNVPLSSVIYASNASVNPASIASSSTFKPLTSSNGYKLTLLDTTRNTFTAQFSENITSKLPGESVTINYSNAAEGDDEFITVLIKDAETGEAKCYNRYPVSGANGSINVTLPHDNMLAFGTYELLVMNEKVGEAYYTNYASPATKLTLMIRDGESPIVTNVYANADNTMFKLTAKDNYKLDKITTMKNNVTYEYVLDNTYEPGTSITQRFNSTCNMDSFMVYDTGGNAVKVSSSNIIKDNIGPEVESITYENGNYTIKVSDTQSGIWKITDSTGNVIYQRYDGITSS